MATDMNINGTNGDGQLIQPEMVFGEDGIPPLDGYE